MRSKRFLMYHIGQTNLRCTLHVLKYIMLKCNCFLSIGLVDYLRKVWRHRAVRKVTQDDR